ncbi:MAG: chemotaxis protein CheD [Desulfobacterales bacterium]
MMLNDNRYHVGAGSYYLDAKKPLILEAYLGTCVGVACYDPVAGIGGMIHLLLPEPVSEKGVTQPEKYATTGFPMFLDALIEAGASVDNMKACIAGGALVGPVICSRFRKLR